MKAAPAPAPTRTASTDSHIEKKAAKPVTKVASTTNHLEKKAAKPVTKLASATISTSKPSVAKSTEKTESAAGRQSIDSEEPGTEQRLARVTAYWAGEGDYYTGRCLSATGVRLHDGHCAVDPNIIPYGSVVEIAGVGKFLAVDTGSAVISRTAARESGHNSAERNAIVVDVFFEDARDGERFAAGAAKFVRISWWTPHSMASEASAAGGLFADEDWTKIQSKQL